MHTQIHRVCLAVCVCVGVFVMQRRTLEQLKRYNKGKMEKGRWNIKNMI